MTLCHGLMEYQQFDFLNEKMNFDTLWSPIFQGVNERCEWQGGWKCLVWRLVYVNESHAIFLLNFVMCEIEYLESLESIIIFCVLVASLLSTPPCEKRKAFLFFFPPLLVCYLTKFFRRPCRQRVYVSWYFKLVDNLDAFRRESFGNGSFSLCGKLKSIAKIASFSGTLHWYDRSRHVGWPSG